MYLPRTFREQNVDQLVQIIRMFPFATLVTQAEGKPFVSHLPMIVEGGHSEKLILLGHMARANPQWKHLAHQNALVVFNGPHAYITPQWYKDPMNVPTWNYVAIHAWGKAALVESADGLHEILKKSVEEFERNEAAPWGFDLPEGFKADLMQAIVGFEINVEQIDGKFKLSQNREQDDYEGVLAGLKTRKDEMSLQMLELMRSRS